MRTGLRIAVLALVASLSTAVRAQQADDGLQQARGGPDFAQARPTRVTVNAGVAQTDNVAQTPVDPISATTVTAGFDVDWFRDGRKLDLALFANVNWVKFLNDEFASRANDGAFAVLTANWGDARDWFRWRFNDTFAQTRLNPFANSTPDNLEYTNVISTGPTVVAPIGDRSFLEFSGDWTNSVFELSDLDSEQLAGSVGIGRRLGPRSSVSLRASAATTEFEAGSPFSSFDTEEYFVRFESVGSRTSLTADLGQATLIEAGTRETTPLIRMNVDRTLGSRAIAFLRAEQRFVPATQLALSQIADPSTGRFGAPIAIGGAAEVRGVSAGWTRTTPRTSFSVETGWRDESYRQNDVFDRVVYVANGRVSRRVRSMLSVFAFGEYLVEELQSQAAPDATFVTLGFGTSWRIGVRTNIAVDWSRRNRSGGGPFDFTENLVSLRINYSLLGDAGQVDGGE